MTGRDESAQAESRHPKRRTVLAAMGAVPVVMAVAPDARAAETATPAVAIDPRARRQTIRGFGGINFPTWIPDLTADQRNTAFGNDEGQLGFTVLRVHVDPDRSNWSKELPTARRAVELGAIVFASPWNPPANMVETFTRDGDSTAQRLRHDKYQAYAEHLNDFYHYMKDNGVELYGISVQNEPDYAYTWTWWTSEEMVTFLSENAGAIDTRVIAPESFQYVKSFSDPILNTPAALANLDILGAHLYGTPYSDFPYPLFQRKGHGKELWMTEVYYPNSSDSADLWPEALDVGEHMHHAMVDAGFQTYVWWYIRRSYGPMLENGQISKRGANMAQFARFVRPGYVRLDAVATPQTDVYTSVYAGKKRLVVVAVNKQTSAVGQPFTLHTGRSVRSASAWVTDATRNVARTAAPAVTGDSFTAELPPQSITTIVLELGGHGGMPPARGPRPPRA